MTATNAVVPTITVSPAGTARDAAAAYARTAGGEDFGNVLGRALQGAVDAGRTADAQSLQALTQGGNLTQAATALTRADLALQGVAAIRDRVVQAYQDVMRMPI